MMNLLTATLICLATAVHAAVEEIPNFLSKEEIEGFRQLSENAKTFEGRPDDKARTQFQVNVTEEIHQRIRVALGEATCVAEGACDTTVSDTEALITTISHSTEPHVDCHANGIHKDDPIYEGEKVGFIYLEDNADAYFEHGESRVSVEGGKLVVFDGSVDHHTVLGEGVKPVDFLGPFAISGDQLSLIWMGAASDYVPGLGGKKSKKGSSSIFSLDDIKGLWQSTYVCVINKSSSNCGASDVEGARKYHLDFSEMQDDFTVQGTARWYSGPAGYDVDGNHVEYQDEAVIGIFNPYNGEGHLVELEELSTVKVELNKNGVLYSVLTQPGPYGVVLIAWHERAS